MKSACDRKCRIKDILRLAELKPECREKILGLNALKIKRRVFSSGDTSHDLPDYSAR